MYSALVNNDGSSKHFAKTRHGEFTIDTEGKGSNPVDTVLAGLCGCIAHEVRDAMLRNKIKYTSFQVKAEADSVADNSRLNSVTVTIDLQDTHIGKEDAAALITAAEGCKVRSTLNPVAPVSISLVANDKACSQAI